MSTVLELLDKQANEQRAMSATEARNVHDLIPTRDGTAKVLADMAAQERDLMARLEQLRTGMIAARQDHDDVAAEIIARESAARTAADAAEALDALAARHRREMSPPPPVEALGGALVASPPPGETAPHRIVSQYTDQAAHEASLTGRPSTPDRYEGGTTIVTLKRMCNGCGAELGDATDDEVLAPSEGRILPDVRGECPNCSTGATP